MVAEDSWYVLRTQLHTRRTCMHLQPVGHAGSRRVASNISEHLSAGRLLALLQMDLLLCNSAPVVGRK